MGPLDKSRKIGDDERAAGTRCRVGIGGDHAEMRLKRRKRIRSDLRTCRRNARDQRGLASVREANEADVREQLQFETKVALLARMSVFMLTRRLMPRSNELGIAVATASASAARGQKSLASLREIEQLFAGFGIVDDSANGNLQDHFVGRRAVAIRTFPMATAPSFKFAIVAVAKERVVVRVRFDVDIAAVSAIAARWATARDVLLPAKREAAVAAVAGLHHDFRFVSKHGFPA